ncbi:MAG: extracellular matrix regulator RemB [Bacillota bacterium]
MFLHIGNSRVVSLEDIVGIFNMELQENPTNLQFLESFPTEKDIKGSRESKNSFIVTTKKVFYSPISPLTLQLRVEKNQI